MNLRVQPAKESSHPSPAGLLRTVWGHVYAGDTVRAVYYVRWNDDAVDEGAVFLVSVGEWSDGGGERKAVALLGKRNVENLAFMIIDAGGTDFVEHEFLGEMLERRAVVDTDLASEVFHIIDHVIVEDERVAELRARIEAR